MFYPSELPVILFIFFHAAALKNAKKHRLRNHISVVVNPVQEGVYNFIVYWKFA